MCVWGWGEAIGLSISLVCFELETQQCSLNRTIIDFQLMRRHTPNILLHMLADIVGQGDMTLDTCLLLLEVRTLLHLSSPAGGKHLVIPVFFCLR